jgi:proteasome lid subunit RPN8/RPN11
MGRNYEYSEWLNFECEGVEISDDLEKVGEKFGERAIEVATSFLHSQFGPELGRHGITYNDEALIWNTYASVVGHGVGLWEEDGDTGLPPELEGKLDKIVKKDKKLQRLADQIQSECAGLKEDAGVEEKHAADFSSKDAAVRSAQSHGATHVALRPTHVFAFNPKGDGYEKRELFFARGKLHWPAASVHVKTLPNDALPIEYALAGRAAEAPRGEGPLTAESAGTVYRDTPFGRATVDFWEHRDNQIGRDVIFARATAIKDGKVYEGSSTVIVRTGGHRPAGTSRNAAIIQARDEAVANMKHRDMSGAEEVPQGGEPLGAEAPYVTTPGGWAMGVLIAKANGWHLKKGEFELAKKITAAIESGNLAKAEKLYEPIKQAKLKAGDSPRGGEPLPSAREEATPVPAEDAVPWVRITRDPEKYEEGMKRAREIGPINSGREIYDLLSPALSVENQEVFLVVLCNLRQECIGVAEVHRGERSRVSVSRADILQIVTKSGADHFHVVHNHPSGDPTPSPADRKLTDAIMSGGDNVDIPCVDHVVIGMGKYYSFAKGKIVRVK